MINIFQRGKKTFVISTESSSKWYKPGDKFFPNAVYTSEGFVKKWKQLEKSKWKLVDMTSTKPKSKSKRNYYVKINKTNKPIPPLLKMFAEWAKKQSYGSVGWFELVTKAIPKNLTNDQDLQQNAFSFLQLPEGSEIVLSTQEKVTYLDSEGGKPKVLAKNLKDFLTLLSLGKTKVMDLDDDGEEVIGRKTLQAWLKSAR